MRRGARKLVTSPKVVLVMLVLKASGLTQFMVLKVSNRNWKYFDSVTWKFFITEASRLKNPGPRTVLRPALPGRTAPCGTGAKQPVLNQFSNPADSCALEEY